jgi:hypothetical protein
MDDVSSSPAAREETGTANVDEIFQRLGGA